MDPGYPPPPPPHGIGFEMHSVDSQRQSPYNGFVVVMDPPIPMTDAARYMYNETGLDNAGVGPAPPGVGLYPDMPGPPPGDAPPPIGFEATEPSPVESPARIGFEGHANGDIDNLDGLDNEGYVDDGPGKKGRLTAGAVENRDNSTLGAGISLLGYKTMTDNDADASSTTVMVENTHGAKSQEDEESSEKHKLVENPPHSASSSARFKKEKTTMLFNDGVREIDYILAFVPDGKDHEKEQKRKTYLENLESQGLEIEQADRSQSKDGKTTFIKIHAPWEVLIKYAELLHMKMPLAENDMEDSVRSLWDLCCSKMPNPFELDEDVVKPEASYFTAVFDRDRIDQFIVGDKKSFFPLAQRSRIVHWILCRAKYEDVDGGDRTKFGINRLLNNKTYIAAFPLHEGEYRSDHSVYAQGADNERHLLYEVWARPRNFYKYQPLDLIRKYFGEKIGIYFTWLGYYTMMLIPAAIVGVVVFIYGVATVWSDTTSNEICDKNAAGNLTMCPNCDGRCSYWKLISSCDYARITYLFDNEATVAFAFFMALWAVVFHEFWKRKQAEIGYDWDVNDYEEEEETVRPEFENSVKRRRTNPINKADEPYLPIWSKLVRYGTGMFVIVVMLAVVIGALFAVIIYRIAVVAVLYRSPDQFIQGRASLITTATSAVISLICIILLGFVYQFIARWLTNIEQPRTDTEWEDSFTLKMFLFQFVNHYGTIFYIAFFKGRFVGRPGDYDYSLSGSRQEECDPAGCLIDLCIQLMIVMVGKQAINNFKELILPKVLVWFRSRKILDKDKDLEESDATRWEKDYCLSNVPNYGLFDEYLEMVIQFGFVTIFVAAFPLAPLFALLNNIVEIRLDAYKFCTQWKRPFAQRAEDIGIWFSILRGVSAVAVISNAFIIAITSDFIPKLVYKYVYNDDRTLSGYMDNSLSYFNVSHFQHLSFPDHVNTELVGKVEICRYRAYREKPWEADKYEHTRQYWHIIAARFAFVIVFENAVVFLSWLISYLIPDVPYSVKIQMLREQHLSGQAILEASRMKDEKRRSNKLD